MLAGCGGSGQGSTAKTDPPEPSATSTPSPSATPTDEPDQSAFLSGQTDIGSPAVFAKRETCVNGSDYNYVLAAFAGAQPPPTKPDAGFVKAGIGRARNLAAALAGQLPADQRLNAEGAVKTWTIGGSVLREQGYGAEDLEELFVKVGPRVEDYVDGNAALTQYLTATCSSKVPNFAKQLAPPT